VKRPHGRIGILIKQCPILLKEILKPYKSIYDIWICVVEIDGSDLLLVGFNQQKPFNPGTHGTIGVVEKDD
jgi:hypothetical protein